MSINYVANYITEKLQKEHATYPHLPLIISEYIQISFSRVIQANLKEHNGLYSFTVEISRVDQDGYLEKSDTIRADYNGTIQWGRLTEAIRDMASPWMRYV